MSVSPAFQGDPIRILALDLEVGTGKEFSPFRNAAVFFCDLAALGGKKFPYGIFSVNRSGSTLCRYGKFCHCAALAFLLNGNRFHFSCKVQKGSCFFFQIHPGDLHCPCTPGFFCVKFTGNAFEIRCSFGNSPDLIRTRHTRRSRKIIRFYRLSILSQDHSFGFPDRFCCRFLRCNILVNLIAHAVIHICPIFTESAALHLLPGVGSRTDCLRFERFFFVCGWHLTRDNCLQIFFQRKNIDHQKSLFTRPDLKSAAIGRRPALPVDRRDQDSSFLLRDRDDLISSAQCFRFINSLFSIQRNRYRIMVYRLKIRIRKCYPDLGFCLVFFRLSGCCTVMYRQFIQQYHKQH